MTMVYALLTVDLGRGTTKLAKNNFGEQLISRHWRKMDLSTTWYAKFQDGVTNDMAINTARLDVNSSAREAKIETFEAAVQIGFEKPTVWNVNL